MKIQALHPDLQKTYGRIPAVPFHNRFFLAVVQWLQGLRSPKAKQYPGVTITDRELANCSIRIYRREENSQRAALLWIHGGGYIMGDVSVNDRECAAVATRLGLVVVSVNYRLAPAHPFPAPLDDCFAAWRFMVDSSDELGIDPHRIAVIGQSAGGGLAAGLVQRIADAGGVQPAAQVLMYPMLDDRTALNSDLDEVGHRLWNNKNNRAGWTWYLGQPAGLPNAPAYAAPARREDLTGLPPTWIGVGDLDLFYEENLRYADRLISAGVPCETYVAPRCPHGYDLIVPDAPVSRELTEHYFRFVETRLLQHIDEEKTQRPARDPQRMPQ